MDLLQIHQESGQLSMNCRFIWFEVSQHFEFEPGESGLSQEIKSLGHSQSIKPGRMRYLGYFTLSENRRESIQEVKEKGSTLRTALIQCYLRMRRCHMCRTIWVKASFPITYNEITTCATTLKTLITPCR